MSQNLYSVVHTEDWVFRPDMKTLDSSILENRGIPALFTQRRGARKMTLLLYDVQKLTRNARRLRNMECSVLKSLSASSSYLGVLSDRKMRKYILNIGMIWMYQYLIRSSSNKFFKIATKISPDKRDDGSVRLADGGTWDNSALAATLTGLQSEDLLFEVPLIIVFWNTPFDTRLWWSNARTRNPSYSEIAFFKGSESDYTMRTFKNKHSLMVVYENVELQETCISSWIPKGRFIHLAFVQVDASHLNSFPIVDEKGWNNYVDLIHKDLPPFLAYLKDKYRSHTFAYAMSGGGMRAAILTSCAISLGKREGIEVSVIGANSGGAWGLYVPPKNTVNHLFGCCAKFKFESYSWRISSYFLTLFFGHEASSMMYLFSLFEIFDYDWEKMIQKVLCFDDKHDAIFHRLPSLRRIVFPSTLLCNSKVS